MGLHKGKTNNKEGRPKGTPNKVTTNLRVLINEFLAENWDQIKEDVKKLIPKDRVYFYEKLMQYDIPKMQSTQLTTDLDRLSDEQVDYIINELKLQIYEPATEN